MVMIKCPHCKELKTGNEMTFRISRPKPYRYWCGSCWRDSNEYLDNLKRYARNYYQGKGKKLRKKYKDVGNKVKKALKDKIITKPLFCSVCGKERLLQGHHDNYSEPLNIRWVCWQCHHDIHVQKRASIVI